MNLGLMQQGKFFLAENVAAPLREAAGEPPLDPKKMPRVMVQVELSETDKTPGVGIVDRSLIVAGSDSRTFDWHVESLRALFRGDGKPPVLGDYPSAYAETFFLIDIHIRSLCNVMGDRRDEELKEVFSVLRRRPDGRSLGVVHDYMWQAMALILALHPLSQAEFEAIMSRLERSCNTFARGSSSRNLAEQLHNLFG